MIFSYAKKLSEKMASLTIKDCVVSLPSHWGPNQRIALSNGNNEYFYINNLFFI